MTTLYLIRHGEKELHAGNPGLTSAGKQQAQQTGRYLQQFPITHIFSSPFKRTVETAEHIGRELGLGHELNEALVERMNWSDPTVTREEFLAEWVRSTNDRHYTPRFGDSSFTTGERIQHFAASLPDESHVVVVSHGGAIVDYLRNAFGDEYVSALRKEYTDGSDYQMSHCAVNIVTLGEPPQLLALHFTGHLGQVSE